MATLTLKCSKSVSISSKYSSNAYTAKDRLAFGRGSSEDEYRLLLGFESLSSIPDGAIISSAKLVVAKTQGAIGSNAKFTAQACRISGSWSTSTTWETKPSYTTTNAATADTGEGHSGNITFDVTGIVKQWVGGTAQYGILLRKSTTGEGTRIKVADVANTSITITYVDGKSTLTASNGTLGTTQTLTINRNDNTFKHKIKYTCGSASGYAAGSASGFTTSTNISWTPPLSLASQNTTSTSVSVTLTLYTYNSSGEEIGNTEKKLTMAMPSSVKPSIGKLTATLAGNYVGGKYVKDHSKVTITASNVTESYGADIKTYTFSGNGWSSSVSSTSATSAVLSKAGDIKFTVTATDTRGRVSAAKTITVTVEDYTAPKITSASAQRANSSEAVTADGTYILVKAAASHASLDGSNTLTLSAAVAGQSSWGKTLSSGKALLAGGAASITKQYTVTITAKDTLGGTATRTLTVFTASRILNVTEEGDGLAVGGYATADRFTSYWPAYFPSGIQYKEIAAADINSATDNGYYRINDDSLSVGGITSSYWYFHVTRFSSKNCVQEMWPVSEKRYKILRWQYDGDWIEEHETPPMAVGKEYRTTERDNGNPVYAKRIQYEFSSTIGNASSTTTTNIAHGISGFQKLVRCHGRLSGSNYQFPYISTSGGITAVTAVNTTNVVVRISNMTWSANTFQFDIFYTK